MHAHTHTYVYIVRHHPSFQQILCDTHSRLLRRSVERIRFRLDADMLPHRRLRHDGRHPVFGSRRCRLRVYDLCIWGTRRPNRRGRWCDATACSGAIAVATGKLPVFWAGIVTCACASSRRGGSAVLSRAMASVAGGAGAGVAVRLLMLRQAI